MATTGREVASGTLWMTKDESTKIRARVVARCGTSDCLHQGQVVIYEESNSMGGDAGQSDQPSRVLLLSTIADVTSLNGSHPTTPNSGAPVFGLSLDGQSPLSCSSLWGVMLLLTSGEAVELFADTREQQQQWIQYLNLLAMFPYSPIPEEPRNNPIRSSLRTKLKPSNYDADSVWLVYILAEEVGSKVQALGVHIVTLRSSLTKGSPALMSIISPVDSEPIVTWEANRMRRTGSLGNMVFIEVGRRCEGGPGLIWMYACPEDSTNYRDTLKRFLFMGDGRPANGVAPPEMRGPMYDRVGSDAEISMARLSVSSTGSSPSSSGSSSFTLSYSGPPPAVVKKSAEYDSADVLDGTIPEYDYAFNTGPLTRGGPNRSSTVPLSATPPPVNLVSHPSRRKELSCHKRSSSIPGKTIELIKSISPVTIAGTNKQQQQQQFRGSIDSGLASSVSLEEDFQSIDESLNSILHDLNETQSKPETEDDGLNDLIAELNSFAGSSDQKPIKRSNTLPSGEKKPVFKRANSTSTCHPMHYLKMHNPKSELMNDGYVMMVSSGRAMLDKVPEEKMDKSSNSTQPTTKRLNYDQLELKEKSVTPPPTEYMNHPLPLDVANGIPVIYQREYQNVSHHDTTHRVKTTPDPSPVKGTTPDPSTVKGTTPDPSPEDEAIYMNYDQAPTTDKEMAELFSSAWNEIDNLQHILEKIGID